MKEKVNPDELVRKFYEVIWNGRDKRIVPELLHEAFVFRGSLGVEKRGHAGFCEYLDAVHEALGEYRCSIGEMVTDGRAVFARMRFSGVHRGELLGIGPTGRRVAWDGAALFHFREGKISDLWVLGDRKSLEVQLSGTDLHPSGQG